MMRTCSVEWLMKSSSLQSVEKCNSVVQHIGRILHHTKHRQAVPNRSRAHQELGRRSGEALVEE